MTAGQPRVDREVGEVEIRQRAELPGPRLSVQIRLVCVVVIREREERPVVDRVGPVEEIAVDVRRALAVQDVAVAGQPAERAGVRNGAADGGAEDDLRGRDGPVLVVDEPAREAMPAARVRNVRNEARSRVSARGQFLRQRGIRLVERHFPVGRQLVCPASGEDAGV